MRRREFIAILGVGTVGWSLAGHAQQTDGLRRVGALFPFRENAPNTREVVWAFAQALARFGWVEGKNVRIDYRFAMDQR